MLVDHFKNCPIGVEVHPAARRAAIGEKQTFAHAVVVENRGAENVLIVLARLRHESLADVNHLFQIRKRKPPGFDFRAISWSMLA